MINEYPEMPDSRARVEAFMSQTKEALVCLRCGGDFFYEVSLRKYAANAYSEMAGGDLVVVGHGEQPIRICVCGEQVAPSISGGRITAGARESQKVVQVVMAAIAMRASVYDRPAAVDCSVELESLKNNYQILLNKFGELGDLTERVAALDKSLAEATAQNKKESKAKL